MNLQNALLAAALNLITSAIAGPSAQLPPVPNYTIAAIPFLPGTVNNTGASAMNVVGASGGHAFLYEKGKLIDIGALFPPSSGVTSSSANAVNAFDEVIGSYAAGTNYGSFIYYYPGGLLELFPNSSFLALNDLGQSVDGNGLRQPNGVITPLPLFNGKPVTVVALNNLGQVAATGITSDIITIIGGNGQGGNWSIAATHALLITGQHVQDLMVSVPTTYLTVFPTCLNDFGAVAGFTQLARNIYQERACVACTPTSKARLRRKCRLCLGSGSPTNHTNTRPSSPPTASV